MPEGVQLFLEKGSCTCRFGTDSIRLLQLINNLANNAIKNTKQGSITLGYTCLPDKHLKFYVKDTGIGIAKDKLGEPFHTLCQSERLCGRNRFGACHLPRSGN